MPAPHQGLWSTLAMFIPLLAVPFLAVIGIPQFTPTAASSEAETAELGDFPPVELGVGESLHHGADDLFAPFESHESPPPSDQSNSSGSGWDDPFHAHEPGQARPGSAPHQSADASLDSPARSTQPQTRRSRADLFADASAKEPPWGEPGSGTDAPPFQDPASSRQAETPGGPNRLFALGADEQTSPSRQASEQPRSLPRPSQDRAFDVRPESSQSLISREHSASPGTSPAVGESLTWGAAVRRLNELGIDDFQLNPGQRENQFQFACTFAPPEAPRIVHRFEAEAADPLAAVQQVLEQVEQWRARR